MVITVKGPDGRLAWVSNQPMAVSAGASFPLPARNEALRAVNATPGLYTVAKVACLRDDTPDPGLSCPGPGAGQRLPLAG